MKRSLWVGDREKGGEGKLQEAMKEKEEVKVIIRKNDDILCILLIFYINLINCHKKYIRNKKPIKQKIMQDKSQILPSLLPPFLLSRIGR
jgi:hypothetical protein